MNREEIRAEAFKEAADLARKDTRTNLAKDVGYIPDWYGYALELADRIEALR
jgi:hypothetical protein